MQEAKALTGSRTVGRLVLACIGHGRAVFGISSFPPLPAIYIVPGAWHWNSSIVQLYYCNKSVKI